MRFCKIFFISLSLIYVLFLSKKSSKVCGFDYFYINYDSDYLYTDLERVLPEFVSFLFDLNVIDALL